MFKYFYLASFYFIFGFAFCIALESRQEVLQPKVAKDIYFKSYDKSFNDLIDTKQKVLLIYDKGVWLEGLQVLANGDLVVSDVKQNRLLRFTILDSIESKSSVKPKANHSNNFCDTPCFNMSIWLSPSHFQNGHALDINGNLMAASHGRRGIEKFLNGIWEIMVDSYKSAKLSSPNDLIVDSDGDVWFSDPRFGLNNPLEGYGGEDMQGGDYLYRFIPSSNELVRIFAKGLHAPNGLALSPDESLLYVADSERAYDFNNKKLHSQIMVYQVKPDKSLGNGKLFATIKNGIPDGIKVDSKGNVWSSSGSGILVFAPNGNKIGKIIFPNIIGNLTFDLSLQEKTALQKANLQVARSNNLGLRLFVSSGSKLYMLTTKVESGIKRNK